MNIMDIISHVNLEALSLGLNIRIMQLIMLIMRMWTIKWPDLIACCFLTLFDPLGQVSMQ